MRPNCLFFMVILSVPAACLAADPVASPTAPPTAVIDQHAAPVQLRALRAVQEARDKAVKWQEAAEEAVSKISGKPLQEQVQQRLASVTPQVAKDLLATPGEVGVATIAAYRESEQGQPVMVAVAYEGLGNTLSESFFPRVISDMPQMSRNGKDESGALLLMDIPASGYLIYELDKGDMKASYIPQALMKQSLGLAIQQARAKTAQVESQEARHDQVETERHAQDQARQTGAANPPTAAQDNQATPAAAGSSPDINYYGSNGYVGYDGSYYNPYGWSPYVVILPAAQEAERQRREAYRHEHPEVRDRRHDTAAPAASGTPVNATGTDANNAPAQARPGGNSSAGTPLPAAPPAHSAPQPPSKSPPPTPPAERPSAPPPSKPGPTPPQHTPAPAPAPPAK